MQLWITLNHCKPSWHKLPRSQQSMIHRRVKWYDGYKIVLASFPWWCCDSAVQDLDSLPHRAADLFLLSIMTLSKWFPLSRCQAAALLPQWRLIGVCARVQVCVLALLYFLVISTNCSFILWRSSHAPWPTEPNNRHIQLKCWRLLIRFVNQVVSMSLNWHQPC